MATREDELLIELALKNHLVSQEEAAECLAASTGDVGQVLISKGYVKERHVARLRKKVPKLLAERPTQAEATRAAASDVGPVQGSGVGSATASSPSQFNAADATFVAPASDSGTGVASSMGRALFGQIAVHKGFLSEGDLKVALNYQETLPLPRPKIGEILVHYRRLTQTQVDEILAYQSEWKAQLQGPDETLPPAGQVSESGRGPSTPDDPGGLLGRTWGDYEVKRILGKGGMGAVYLATQRGVMRDVALKVMLRPPGRQSAGDEERTRFVREARLVANLRHPNVVSIYEADLNDDFSWFTMELVPGKDFKQVLRSGTFPMRSGAGIVAKVARAMEFAHERGVIHRDLKPQNIMIDEDSGEPKILDFGLAKNVDAKDRQEQLTQMGAFLGTPAYMAPEQAGGDPNAVDCRADTYALGAILYEVLTGRPPFTGSSAINVIKKVLKEDPKHPQEIFAQAEGRLSKVALKALAKEPERRYQTAAELADDVEAVIGRVTRTLKDTGISVKPEGEESKESGDSGTKGFFGRLFGG